MRQYRGLIASERSAIYSALIFQTAGVVAGVSECPEEGSAMPLRGRSAVLRIEPVFAVSPLRAADSIAKGEVK